MSKPYAVGQTVYMDQSINADIYLPKGSCVTILQVVNHGTQKRPEYRYQFRPEEPFQAHAYWVDPDALTLGEEQA